MNRTYDTFVDNGLYVLSYYLDKNIEEITIDNIKNSTEYFSNKFVEYEKCGFYKKNIDMGFHNSQYTQTGVKGSLKKDNVLNQYNLLLNNIGDDEYCSICGEKHIKLDIDEQYNKCLTRSLMPRLHSNTFMNYTNNLQRVNVCPICLYLSMLSLFNYNKAGSDIVLYDSDDNEFMEDMTYEKQLEVKQNIAMNTKEPKGKISNFKFIQNTIEHIINSKKLYNGYIKAVSFYNGGQSEDYSEELISKKDMIFINNLMKKSLLAEFKEKYLFNKLINNQLQTNYIPYVMDFNKGELKISKELFTEIEEVYNKLSQDKLQLVKNICKKVYSTNNKDEISQLKNISSIIDFQELLIKWSAQYEKIKHENMFDSIEDFDALCNFKEFKTIKNTMLMQFMLL